MDTLILFSFFLINKTKHYRYAKIRQDAHHKLIRELERQLEDVKQQIVTMGKDKFVQQKLFTQADVIKLQLQHLHQTKILKKNILEKVQLLKKNNNNVNKCKELKEDIRILVEERTELKRQRNEMLEENHQTFNDFWLVYQRVRCFCLS